jgi:hypothetical protein
MPLKFALASLQFRQTSIGKILCRFERSYRGVAVAQLQMGNQSRHGNRRLYLLELLAVWRLAAEVRHCAVESAPCGS